MRARIHPCIIFFFFSFFFFFFVIQVKHQLYNRIKEKEKDNKYKKSSGYTVQGGGYGGETVEPQRCIALP